MRIFLIYALSITTLVLRAQVPNWQWAKSIGGNSTDDCSSSATDAYGNYYVTGFFKSNSIKFDSTILVNVNSASDYFIAKYDVSGNVLWARGTGGTGDDAGTSICVDFDGNCYVTGIFNSPTIAFDTFAFNNVGNRDIFLLKYDSLGNLLWAKSFGGNGDDACNAIKTNLNGEIILTGRFGSSTLNLDTISLSNTGQLDVFSAKFNSSGDVVWAKSAKGSQQDYGADISSDSIGNSYITGYTNSPAIIFDEDTLINTTGYSAFILKYDVSGNIDWAINSKGYGFANVYSKGISTDNNGNSFITGYFGGDSISFKDINLINTLYYTYDVFLIKIDSVGNVYWVKSAGGLSSDASYSITSDNYGNCYLTGAYKSDSVKFGNYTLLNKGMFDSFIVKYNSNGDVLWAKDIGGTDYDEGISIAVNNFGDIYIVGHYASPSLVFNNDSIFNSNSLYDVFVAKLGTLTELEGNQMTYNVCIYPNPSCGHVYIKGNENIKDVTINNISGKVVCQKTVNEKKIDIDIEKSGIYFITIFFDKQVLTKKICVLNKN